MKNELKYGIRAIYADWFDFGGGGGATSKTEYASGLVVKCIVAIDG